MSECVDRTWIWKGIRWLPVLLYAVVSVCAIRQQVNGTHSAFYPSDAPKPNWFADTPVSFKSEPVGQFQYPTMAHTPVMLSRGAEAAPSSFQAELPAGRTGCSVVLLTERFFRSHTPRLTLLAGDRALASVDLAATATEEPPPYLLEIPLDSDSMSSSGGALTVQNRGGTWRGSLLMIPHLLFRRAMLIGYPLLAVLALLAARMLTAGHPRLRLCLVFCLAYPLFYYHLFHLKMAPMGVFFGDGKELADAVRRAAFTFDSQKHPLYLPLMQVLTQILAPFGRGLLQTVAITTAVMASANLTIASAVIDRLVPREALRWLLLPVYLLSFAILTYSSIYETYLLSTLLLNAAILGVLACRVRPSPYRRSIAWLSAALLPLASPPLLAFVPASAIVVSRQSGRGLWRAVLGCVASFAGILATSAIVLHGILATYGHAPDDGTSGIAEALKATHEKYATWQNLQPSRVAGAVKDTVLTAIVNPRHMPVIGQNGAPFGPTEVLQNVLTTMAAVAMVGLLVVAIMGVRRSRLTPVRAAVGGAVLLYLVFHCYFNAAEMVLYLSPVLLVLLVGLTCLAYRGAGERARFILLFLLVVQTLSVTFVNVRAASSLFVPAPAREPARVVGLNEPW